MAGHLFITKQSPEHNADLWLIGPLGTLFCEM